MPEDEAQQFSNDILENIQSLVGFLEEPKAQERDLLEQLENPANIKKSFEMKL